MTFSIYVAGWTLIHFVWQGALVAGAAATVLWWLADALPNERYIVACTALAAMLAVPIVTAGFIDEPAPNGLTAAASREPQQVRLRQRIPAAPGREGALVLNRVERTGVPWRAKLDPILPVLVAVWVIGVVGLLLRLAGGWWRIRRLRGEALAAASSQWLDAARRMAERLGVARRFHIVDSPLVETPMLVGWLRPIVLLPIAALANLAPAQVDAILAHELAHIRRHDYLVNLLQTIAETLLFYHPAVWWVSARIRIEREHCCDDVAVEATGDVAAYAAALTELETLRTGRSALALAATDGPLLTRVRRLLGTARGEPPGGSSPLALALVGVLLVFAFSVLRPVSASRITSKAASDVALNAESPAPILLRQQSRPIPPPPPPPPPSRANWRVEETDHVLLTCEAAAVVDLERVGREAERAYNKIAADLRTDLSGRPTLTVFSTRAELQRALANGVVRPARESLGQMLVTLDVSDDQLRRDLVIDLTRAFAFEIVPASVTDRPFWMHDGLAEHESGVWDRADAAMLATLVSSRSVPRVTGIIPSTFAAQPRLPLVVGHAAFDFIETRWGKDGVRRFLAAARRRPAGAAGLYGAAFNVTADEFDRGFEEYLTATFAAPGQK